MNETWWVNAGQLDEDQKAILRADPADSLVMKGPPGSGKTNILLLRANYVRATRPRLLFLTFTRTLAEFIKSGSSIGRPDQIQRDEISTFMRWGKKFLNERGAHFVDPGGTFTAVRNALFTQIQSCIEKNGLGKFYDTIFVDEVQDFRKQEIDILSHLTHTFNAAGDSRQSIWQHNEGLPTAESYASSVVKLSKHYRIGQNICEFADRMLPPLAGEDSLIANCFYDEANRPSSVNATSCLSTEEQYRSCLAELKRQIRYIIDEPILVLSHTKAARDAFWDVLEEDGELVDRSIIQSSEGYEAFGPNSLIRVMTIASAKGSEARAVHILKADRLSASMRELAFTGVTRAKTEVILYHTSALPNHLLKPVEKLPAIDALF